MDTWEIHKKIDIVLAEEKRAYAANGRPRGGLGSMNITLQSVPNHGWTTEGQIPVLLFEKSDPNVEGRWQVIHATLIAICSAPCR
jgi:hypothetical protein